MTNVKRNGKKWSSLSVAGTFYELGQYRPFKNRIGNILPKRSDKDGAFPIATWNRWIPTWAFHRATEFLSSDEAVVPPSSFDVNRESLQLCVHSPHAARHSVRTASRPRWVVVDGCFIFGECRRGWWSSGRRFANPRSPIDRKKTTHFSRVDPKMFACLSLSFFFCGSFFVCFFFSPKYCCSHFTPLMAFRWFSGMLAKMSQYSRMPRLRGLPFACDVRRRLNGSSVGSSDTLASAHTHTHAAEQARKPRPVRRLFWAQIQIDPRHQLGNISLNSVKKNKGKNVKPSENDQYPTRPNHAKFNFEDLTE